MNDIFKKIYCINLDFRTDRWEICENFFDKNNLEVERWDAVKGSDAAYASTLSHYNLVKRAKELNLENVFIFEDDFQFTNYNIDLIKKAFRQLPKDWDVFYLGYNPFEKLLPYSENLYKIQGAWTTHAYAINKRFYDVIIDNFVVRMDIILANFQKTHNFYGINPCICIQRNDWSDIDHRFNPNGDIILDSVERFSK